MLFLGGGFLPRTFNRRLPGPLSYADMNMLPRMKSPFPVQMMLRYSPGGYGRKVGEVGVVSVIRWTAAAMRAWILNPPELKGGGAADVGTNRAPRNQNRLT